MRRSEGTRISHFWVNTLRDSIFVALLPLCIPFVSSFFPLLPILLLHSLNHCLISIGQKSFFCTILSFTFFLFLLFWTWDICLPYPISFALGLIKNYYPTQIYLVLFQASEQTVERNQSDPEPFFFISSLNRSSQAISFRIHVALDLHLPSTV